MSKLSAEEEESIEAELAALQQEAMPSVPVNVRPGWQLCQIVTELTTTYANSKNLFD